MSCYPPYSWLTDAFIELAKLFEKLSVYLPLILYCQVLIFDWST